MITAMLKLLKTWSERMTAATPRRAFWAKTPLI
jgi:hypothetical protein